MEPSYKQHTAVDDSSGVIVDVKTTTGEASEGKELIEQIERVEQMTGKKVEKVTADAAYAHCSNFRALEERGTCAVIPPQTEPRYPARIPLCRFKYDGKHQVVRCPTGRILRRTSRTENGWIYRALSKDCNACPLRVRCISAAAKVRIVLIVDSYESLLRARRRHRKKDMKNRQIYTRHRWLTEGVHDEAKTQHGLRRAARRGLTNVTIQVYMTAIVMNLKRLAAFLLLISMSVARKWRISVLIEDAVRFLAGFWKMIINDLTWVHRWVPIQ